MGLSSNANIEDIKKAYQKLAMKYHPDRRPNDPHAADKFTRMKKAFDILSAHVRNGNCQDKNNQTESNKSKSNSNRASRKNNSTPNKKNTLFKSKPDLSAFHRTDSTSFNEYCRRHPAITDSCMSEHGIGLNVESGKYCISVRSEFEFPGEHTHGNYNWQRGWAQTDTLDKMLELIKRIRVVHKQSTHFGTFVGKETTTTWSPIYTDGELDISREPDGSISLWEI